jgi:hypothetical protein
VSYALATLGNDNEIFGDKVDKLCFNYYLKKLNRIEVRKSDDLSFDNNF